MVIFVGYTGPVEPIAEMGTSAVVRVIEQCCFNSVSDWLF